MLPSASRLTGRRFTFQHDNDPKHTAKRVKAFLEQKHVRVLEWPPQSPDLNPIEHMWDELERQRPHDPPSNKQQLKDTLQRTWNAIGQETCAKLVDSMPRRLLAVIKAKGGPTKY